MSNTTFKMATNGKQFLIKDAIAYWAKVHTAVPKYKATNGEKEYSIELLIPEDVVDQLDAHNINKQPTEVSIKNKKALKKGKEAPYPDEYSELSSLKLASPSTWPDGKEKEIVVVMNKLPMTEDIGNGSIVDVIVRVGKANSDGLCAVYLEKVNVKELVAYEGGDEFDFETSDGFQDDDIDFG